MKRISGYIEDELYLEIEKIAEYEKRKVTPMISLLLQLAVKEKTRKRNGRKADTEHNPSNMGSGNSQ